MDDAGEAAHAHVSVFSRSRG